MKTTTKSVLTVFFALFLSSTMAFAQKTVQASDILADIKQGKDISYENVTIEGTFDMTYMDEKKPELPKEKNGTMATIPWRKL